MLPHEYLGSQLAAGQFAGGDVTVKRAKPISRFSCRNEGTYLRSALAGLPSAVVTDAPTSEVAVLTSSHMVDAALRAPHELHCPGAATRGEQAALRDSLVLSWFKRHTLARP
jgi:hypothetical protein